MSDALTILVSVIASGGTTLAICQHLIQKRVEHEFNMRLATHTAELNRKMELELAEFKHKLELAAAERNHRFSRVFDKTATAIADTHQQIVEFSDAVYAQIILIDGSADQSRESLIAVMKERWEVFQAAYKRNRIYIPKRTNGKIAEISEALMELERKYIRFLMAENANINEVALERHEKGIDELLKKIPSLRAELVDEFQSILGFPPEMETNATSK